MIRFRSKHVCTPSARKFKPHKPKAKVKVVAVERLPANYVPEVTVKRRKKPIDPAKYAVSDREARSTKNSSDTTVPRITVVCGGVQVVKKMITQRKIDRVTTGNAKDFPIDVTGFKRD